MSLNVCQKIMFLSFLNLFVAWLGPDWFAVWPLSFGMGGLVIVLMHLAFGRILFPKKVEDVSAS